MKAALLGVLLALHCGPAISARPSCLPQSAVLLQVRIGDSKPMAALLQGGLETTLSLFAATSRRLLWSADESMSAIQVFPGLSAPVTGSLTAIDLDADGLHDRIYVGDMAARLWRFDLHHGEAAAEWATGGVFADFSNGEGRGFLAAPSISLSTTSGASSWLDIAIGTAAPGSASANNRFYALRDRAVAGSWTSDEFDAWEPLRETDLVHARATPQAAAEAAMTIDPAAPGWYVELGSGHVITPTITVHGRAVLAIAAEVPRDSDACEVFARIANFDLATSQMRPSGSPAGWSVPLAAAIPASARFTLGTEVGGLAPCTLGGERIAACDVDTRPRRTWWRRLDAE
jgi:hypothetical protein